MKKQLWLLLLCMNIPNVYAARGERKALEVNPTYVALKNEVAILSSRYRYLARNAKSVATYIIQLRAVGIMPEVLMKFEQYHKDMKAFDEDEIDDETMDTKRKAFYSFLLQSGLGFLIPAIGFGMGGAVFAELDRNHILGQINHVLTTNNIGYDFIKLPIDDAIMVLAAYQKNIYVMRKLKPFVHSFLEKPGVLQALAQLYFYKPSWWRPSFIEYIGPVTPQMVEKLKELIE